MRSTQESYAFYSAWQWDSAKERRAKCLGKYRIERVRTYGTDQYAVTKLVSIMRTTKLSCRVLGTFEYDGGTIVKDVDPQCLYDTPLEAVQHGLPSTELRVAEAKLTLRDAEDEHNSLVALLKAVEQDAT